MKVESGPVQVEGYLLNRLILHPDDNCAVRAEAIFYHGQGDYAERYTEVLSPFTDRGIRCIITELPGHGRSPGRRGHCGDESLLDAIVGNTLELIARNDLPYGVMGHSMGGLLAARHLVLAGQDKLPVAMHTPAFAWLSSPLMKPSRAKSDILIKLIRFLAPLLPSLTVSTGVTPAVCRVKSEEPEGNKLTETANSERSEQEASFQLWHSRISLGWGNTLLDIEELVRIGMSSIPNTIPLLYTQGGGDVICPPEIARDYFSRLPNATKRYEEMENLLHEPFRGDGSELLFSALNDWLESLGF